MKTLDRYVHAYDNPNNPLYHKARDIGTRLRSDTILTVRGIYGGVLRWRATGRVVEEDCARLAEILGIRLSLTRCRRIRGMEYSRS